MVLALLFANIRCLFMEILAMKSTVGTFPAVWCPMEFSLFRILVKHLFCCYKELCILPGGVTKLFGFVVQL